MVTNAATSVCYDALTAIGVPLLRARGVVDANWRESLDDRLGAGAWNSLPFSVGQKRVWFHGASVGEVAGLSPLVKAVRSAWPELGIALSTTSQTGKRSVVERKLADLAALLPFERARIIRDVIRRLEPKLFLVTETEIWPNLSAGLANAGVPQLLINARISDYSFPRYRRLRGFVAPALARFEQVLAQSDADAARLIELGAREEVVSVVGSTKYDQARLELTAEEKSNFAAELGIDLSQPCFVAGSVREGEDLEIIRAYQATRKRLQGSTDLNLQLIIAPRHPQRFQKVAELLRAEGIEFSQRSLGPVAEPRSVVLLDTLGELARAYTLASVAFVGGTLVDIGGHNPLEPASNQTPVMVGPHTGNVRDAISRLREMGGVFQVEAGAQLQDDLFMLLTDQRANQKAGAAAYQVWRENQGATEHVMQVLGRYM